MLALYLGMLGADFTIVESPELVAALRTLTGRYHRAIEASQQRCRPAALASYGAARARPSATA